MKVIHRPEVMRTFPANYTFAMQVRDISQFDAIAGYTADLVERITAEHIERRVKPAVEAWQSIFAAMGASPKHESSLKALATGFQTNGRLPSIHPVVDFYNAFSLYHAVPMGGYDLNRLVGDVELCVIGKGRSFTPLGNTNPNNLEKTKANEVGYVDGEKVICRHWNRKDCDQTKITAKTTDVVFIFDVVRPQEQTLEQMFDQLHGEFTALFSRNDVRGGILGPGIATEVEL